MHDPYHVTLVARIVVSVDAPDRHEAERRALAQARTQAAGMPWTVEHVEAPWGT